ncbi:helicase POLQ-like isoform X2 [Penaeus chinensis]|uniref:helicase POLQ-like isoform X2 n=1 Tax=Penaeus chinensis TaxID=139456 RepID=UPI001FB662E6|nr:helicase POLQ-like isoform X2 [Penaeus chinensis]
MPNMNREAREIMSSPVFRSQRLSRKSVFRNALISKNDTCLSPSPKNIQPKSPRSPLSSPLLRSQRKVRCGVGVGTDENTPSRKRPRGYGERQTTKKMLDTPKSTTPRSRKSVVIDSPSTVFMNHDDSFLESVNFDELDSLCSSLELTPLEKTKALDNNRTPLSNSGLNSSPYLLRKTPRRINLQLTSENIQPPRRTSNNQNAITKARKQISDNFCKEKIIDNKCIVKTSDPKKFAMNERSVIPESSCSTNSSHPHMSSVNCSYQTNDGITKASSKKTSGRSSPDIFGEEQLDSQFDDTFGLTDTQMSCLDEAYFDGSSEPSHNTQDFIKPSAKVVVKSTSSHEAANIKNTTSQEISPLTSNGQAPHNKSGDSFGSPDSQLSFISTQGSQPLLDRFQNRFKDAVASDQTDAPIKTTTQRRAEVVAAAMEAVETNLNDDFELGPFFGLPSKVLDVLSAHRGISKLYDWQEECIIKGSGSENLIFSLPTSGGKTLVAEVLMLRQLLLKKQNALLILPYVALVQEKVRGLAPFGVELEFLIEEYAGSRGSFPPKAKRKKSVLYIATIEKASGLVNALLETDRMQELGLVVVDEVHMLAEPGGRGAMLESIITKLRYAARKVQLVAMSATVGNLNELASFLGAQLYTGNFRPVELAEYVKIINQIWEINTSARVEEDLLKNKRLSCFPYSQEQKKIDIDMVGGLVGEVVPEHSCLVFCPTKRNCETLAELVCRILPKELTKVRVTDKRALYRALSEEGSGVVCPILRRTIPYGVAYHHSGLTEGERRLLEEGYLAGTLCCLCCTSTLAAGVNLPARRVIIRSPYTGSAFLTRARYKQMVGRAGRAGLDTCGESFLILQPKDTKEAGLLLLSPVEVCTSTLADQEWHGLTGLVFTSLGLGVAVTLPQLKALTRRSLLTLQANRLNIDVEPQVDKIVEDLRAQGLVRIKVDVLEQKSSKGAAAESSGSKGGQSEQSQNSTICNSSSSSPPSLENDMAQIINRPICENDILTVSRLGRAAVKGNVELKLAGQLYKDLCHARENLAVNSHLHLLFLVTPYDAAENIKIIPDVYYSAYSKLATDEVKVAKVLGITEAVMVRISMGQNVKKVKESVLKRFYLALLLFQLWSGMSIWEASEMFRIHRGFTQQALSSSSAFASCVFHFCQELEELWAFRDLLANFTRQLSGCCTAELLPLLDLPSVKKGRARLLYNAGYHTLKDIANANAKDLTQCVDHLPFRTAAQIVSSAKMLLLEQAEALQGEAEEVLSGLREASSETDLPAKLKPNQSEQSASVRIAK